MTTKPLSISLLGFNLNVPVPATVEDFDAAGGEEGLALSMAISQFVYRTPASRWRNIFLQKIEEETGIKRARKLDDSGKEIGYDESEKEYWERVESSPDFDASQFSDLAEQCISEVGAWWPTPGSSGRIGKEWITQADNLKVVIDEQHDKRDNLLAKFEAAGVKVHVNPDGIIATRDLAMGLKTFDEIQRREREANLLS